MEWDRLSGGENSSYQKVFIALDFLVYFILVFGSLGLISNFNFLLQPGQLYFYVLFGLIFATIPSIYDQLAGKDRESDIVDTVSLEEEDAQIHPSLGNWKMQLIIGLILSAIIGYQIVQTQSVWVAYPTFAIRFPFLTGTTGFVANIIFATIASAYVESRVFWSFIQPSVYNFIQKKFDSVPISLIASTIVVTGSFLVYHLFVYANSTIALTSVVLFGLTNSLMVILLRSVVSNILVHATNNGIGAFLNLSRSLFGIVL